MKAIRSLVVLALTALVVACGGGGDDGGGQPATGPTLSTAKSFGEFVNNELSKWFNAQSISRFASYDNDLSAVWPGAWTAGAGTANPFVLTGPFRFYVARNQGFTNQFPTITGDGTMLPLAGFDRRAVSYESRDFFTRQEAFGRSRLYWGIRYPTLTDNSVDDVPIILIVEGIVELSGVPQYRAIQILEGRLKKKISTLGNNLDNAVLVGSWSQFAVEAYNGGITGQLGTPYRACMEFSSFSLSSCN